MAYTYGGTSINYPKTDKVPVPAYEDPRQYIAATDWNTTCAAVDDLRSAVLGGTLFGFTTQSSRPSVTGASKFLWVKTSDGHLYYYNGSTDTDLSSAGGSGTVTSVVIGNGLASTQSPLTTTGTMSIDTSVVVDKTTTQTLTNKTLTAPVLGGSITGTYTLAGTPTITAPAISAPVLSGTATGTYTLGGTPSFPTNATGMTVPQGTSIGEVGGTAKIGYFTNNLYCFGEVAPWTTLTYALGDASFVWTAAFCRHYQSGGSAPTIAAGTGAGTSPTVTVTGTDTSGIINVTTGTSPASSNAIVATITFNTAFASAPRVIISENNALTVGLYAVGSNIVRCYSADTTTTTFAIRSGAVALTASSAYSWQFMVLG